jgi:predicted enzyme related to lactoylglutathione lyase
LADDKIFQADGIHLPERCWLGKIYPRVKRGRGHVAGNLDVNIIDNQIGWLISVINQERKGNSAMTSAIGPDFITLQVRDLETSKHFYGEVLGLKTSPEVRPNAVAFATQPVGFAIRKAQIDLDTISKLGHGVILWFHCEDAAALCKHLQEQNVPITQGLADSPFGKTFTFRDPDGYLITMHDGG